MSSHNVKKLLTDAIVEEGWDSNQEEWCVLIPKWLFDNIVDHLLKNGEDENNG